MQALAPVPFPVGPNDHAFTLDTGETVVVEAAPQPYTPGQAKVDVFVAARLVDAQSGATLAIDGHPVVCPSHAYGMTGELIANGGDLAVLVADGIQDQAQRVRRTAAALASLARMAGRDATPVPVAD